MQWNTEQTYAQNRWKHFERDFNVKTTANFQLRIKNFNCVCQFIFAALKVNSDDNRTRTLEHLNKLPWWE